MRKIKNLLNGRVKTLTASLCVLSVCFLLSMLSISVWGPNKSIIKLGGTSFAFVGMVATMKKKGKWDGLDQEEKDFFEAQDEAYKGLIDKDALDAKLKEFVAKTDLKNQLSDEQVAELKDLNTGYKNIAKELEKIKDLGLSNAAGDNPVMAALKSEAFTKFTKKESRTIELNVKSVAIQGAADIATHTIGTRVPGIGKIPVRKPFLLDLFPSVATNLEYVRYMDQESVVRDAKNVYGTNTSSHTTKVTWKERSIQIMKIRDLIAVSIDMLEDYDFVMGEINQLMSESVMLQADSQILSGDGSSPNFHSIDEYAGEFDPTSTLTGTVQAVAGTVPAPNIFDLCLCMAAQISSLGKKGGYQPNTVLMNDFDTYLNNFVKDKNDNYILPPFVQRTADGEYTIHNMLVRSNPLVPANTLYVFDRFKGKIFYRKGFVLEMAYNNGTDFEIDQVTVKGVMRMNFFVRNVDINAFMVCSDVAGAINQLKKV